MKFSPFRVFVPNRLGQEPDREFSQHDTIDDAMEMALICREGPFKGEQIRIVEYEEPRVVESHTFMPNEEIPRGKWDWPI